MCIYLDADAFISHFHIGSLAMTTSNSAPRGLWTAILAILALWAAGILTLAANGIFDVPLNQPALPTLVAIVAPLAAFFVAYRFMPAVRELVLSLDPVLLTEMQAWRILGGVFIVVYAFGHLPGAFAWPAGLGDIAVGVAAPFAAWRLRRNPGFLFGRRYRTFLFFGLADFVVAVTMGLLSRGDIAAFSTPVTSAAMGQMPLVLIPTLIVPAFIILHLIVLLQIVNAAAQSCIRTEVHHA